jgi:hypothetical protein
MFIDGMEAEFVVLSDPDPSKPIARPRSPNVPSDESKIILDADRRPAIVMDIAAYDRWCSEYSFEESGRRLEQMWEAVRHFDAAAIQHLPFLLTAQQFAIMVQQGRFNLSYTCVMPEDI